ncbi:hypothetical protein VT06_16495 [Arsukibacterium sp. MJ3]|nr:hypothetical protein VT06_16495 [Arsukibacterium sp. MJ3]
MIEIARLAHYVASLNGGKVKLVYFSIILLSVSCIILIPFVESYFAMYFALSLLPINILHGNRNVKDFHKDDKRYQGAFILTYPPVIFIFLVLNHGWWLG